MPASHWPFTLASPEALDYSAERFPGTFAGLDQALVFGWNERYTSDHVDYLAASIAEAVDKLVRGR